MIVSRDSTTDEVFVLAISEGLKLPYIISPDGDINQGIFSPEQLMNNCERIDDTSRSLLYFLIAKNHHDSNNPDKQLDPVYTFIKQTFSDVENECLLDFIDLSNYELEGFLYLITRYRAAIERIQSGSIYEATRRFFELLHHSTLDCSNQKFSHYIRTVYLILVWSIYCLRNDKLNNVTPCGVDSALRFLNDSLSIKSSNVYKLYHSYLASGADEVLFQLAQLLGSYSLRLGNSRAATGSVIFGTVDSISETFGTIKISSGNMPDIIITNRDIQMWAAMDEKRLTKAQETVAVGIRANGENPGTRRGELFVKSVIDVFFPVMEYDNDKRIDIIIGGNGTFALAVCRAAEKGRLVAGVSSLRQLTSLVGVARLAVTTSGYSSRQDNTLESSIKHYVNDVFRDLIIDKIDCNKGLVEVRLELNDLVEVDPRKLRTFIKISEKAFPELEFIPFYGTENNKIRIKYDFYAHCSEYDYFEESQLSA